MLIETVTNLETGWTQITTSLTGFFNDIIEVYCKKDINGKIIISDDNWTLHNLSLVNSNFDMSKIDQILKSYGVQSKYGELLIEASDFDFKIKLKDLVLTIKEICDICCNEVKYNGITI